MSSRAVTAFRSVLAKTYLTGLILAICCGASALLGGWYALGLLYSSLKMHGVL